MKSARRVGLSTSGVNLTDNGRESILIIVNSWESVEERVSSASDKYRRTEIHGFPFADHFLIRPAVELTSGRVLKTCLRKCE